MDRCVSPARAGGNLPDVVRRLVDVRDDPHRTRHVPVLRNPPDGSSGHARDDWAGVCVVLDWVELVSIEGGWMVGARHGDDGVSGLEYPDVCACGHARG